MLEDKLGETAVHGILAKAYQGMRGYVVDTSASLMFYTPLMSISEACSGMESNEIVHSRASALLLHAIVARVSGKVREYWASYWQTDTSSSTLRKFIVDTTAPVLVQLPAYSIILAMSGASLEEGLTALPIGLCIGAATGRPYGRFLDYWRKTCGMKPMLS